MDEFSHIYEEKPPEEEKKEVAVDETKSVLAIYKGAYRDSIGKSLSGKDTDVSTFGLGQDPAFFEDKHFHEAYLVNIALKEIPDNIHGLILSAVLKHNGPITPIDIKD